MLRFLTAGESHGPGLTVILEGIPHGAPVRKNEIDAQLRRRQQGYGRGGRMKLETDAAELTGGVRHGRAMGGPIALYIRNKDYENWRAVMDPNSEPPEPPQKAITHPRPGHADLAGALKFATLDARDVLERASARETTARVAAGAIARQLLAAAVGIELRSGVVALGAVRAETPPSWDALGKCDDSPFRTPFKKLEPAMKSAVDGARIAGDTLGGVIHLEARGLPPGLGSHVQWDRKLDGRIAQALMSIHAVKAVEIGEGVAAAGQPGSAVHDEIGYDAKARRFTRPSNRAGGIEGGISNGEPVICRIYLKPIPTLMRPLMSVDFVTRRTVDAQKERSDTCVVPAAGVIAEAMLALVLAHALLEKFGGDSLASLSDSIAREASRLRAL